MARSGLVLCWAAVVVGATAPLSTAAVRAGTPRLEGCPGRSQCHCPCSPSSLCDSLPRGAARDSNATVKRAFAFHEGPAIYNGSASEWGLWDWDAVTTVVTGAIVGGDEPENWNTGTWCLDHYCHNISQELLCHAHERGVRVVGFTYWPWNTSPQAWGQLANATKRRLWIEGAVATAVHLGLDGYNVDIEAQTNASLRDSLTSLTCELRAALTAAIPGATLSFDLNIGGPSGGGYDYQGLANCLDTLTLMAYCMVDPVAGTMLHHANAPLPSVLGGLAWYRQHGIPLAKLDVALPWFGYDYLCNSSQPGKDCVPPAGFPNTQPGLGQTLDLHAAVGSPRVVFDNVSVSKYFDYVEQTNASGHYGHRRRVTYDDAKTLAVKYKAVFEAGVGGIGIWTADATHRNSDDNTKLLAKQMWAAVGLATEDAVHRH